MCPALILRFIVPFRFYDFEVRIEFMISRSMINSRSIAIIIIVIDIHITSLPLYGGSGVCVYVVYVYIVF